MTNERIKENVLEEVSPQYCGARDLIGMISNNCVIRHAIPRNQMNPFYIAPYEFLGL